MATRRETFALLASALVEASSQNTNGQGTDRLTVPFEYASNRSSLLVRARIDRRPARLVVDTGSTHCIVAASFLGVKPSVLSPTQPGAGILGDAIGQEVALELGPRSWRRRVAVMDLSRVLSNYQERIDGLLGLDFLMEFSRVVLNFQDRTVTFIR